LESFCLIINPNCRIMFWFSFEKLSSHFQLWFEDIDYNDRNIIYKFLIKLLHYPNHNDWFTAGHLSQARSIRLLENNSVWIIGKKLVVFLLIIKIVSYKSSPTGSHVATMWKSLLSENIKEEQKVKKWDNPWWQHLCPWIQGCLIYVA
jgi:hypothetical protein